MLNRIGFQYKDKFDLMRTQIDDLEQEKGTFEFFQCENW
jgi:hypothetical protein